MTQEITATLPSNVVYVTGTVNSVPVTWTRSTGNDWRATAEKSDNNLYHVELTAINSAGTSANYVLDLQLGLQLITDRTLQDVINRTDIGYYDWVDYNRVGAAVQTLSDALQLAGYAVDTDPKTDWTRDDIQTPAQLETYLQNVQNLRAALEAGSTMPELPTTMSNITYVGANNIEMVLQMLEQYLFLMMQTWFYSGEIQCGEV